MGDSQLAKLSKLHFRGTCRLKTVYFAKVTRSGAPPGRNEAAKLADLSKNGQNAYHCYLFTNQTTLPKLRRLSRHGGREEVDTCREDQI